MTGLMQMASSIADARSIAEQLKDPYAAPSDHTGLERAAERLDRLNMELGVDMEEATAAILSQLSKSV
ncbi:hypothetical protein OG422_29255 [Streptomyces sp. NBC_01525]|uniref:hypothetical protein n=1 Tax=Streptomyces sp. NBC_01525 TaxID=2903893 RepID=UPI00386FDDEA